MKNIKEWQASKDIRVVAEKWVNLLSKRNHTDNKYMKLSTVHFGIKLVIAGQEYQSGNNYHDSPKSYNQAMAEVITNNFKTLNEQALAILKEDEAKKQALCKSELVAILKEIDECTH